MSNSTSPCLAFEVGLLAAAFFSLAVPALVWFSWSPVITEYAATKHPLRLPFVGEIGVLVYYRQVHVYAMWVASAVSTLSGMYAIAGAFHPLARRRWPAIAATSVIVAMAGLAWAAALYWPVFFTPRSN